MKDGRCPKCNSTEVYTAENGFQREPFTLALGGLLDGIMQVALSDYVCRACGYHEQYVQDRAAIEKIVELAQKGKRGWKRVES